MRINPVTTTSNHPLRNYYKSKVAGQPGGGKHTKTQSRKTKSPTILFLVPLIPLIASFIFGIIDIIQSKSTKKETVETNTPATNISDTVDDAINHFQGNPGIIDSIHSPTPKRIQKYTSSQYPKPTHQYLYDQNYTHYDQNNTITPPTHK